MDGTAVVTGGSRGIGAAVAKALAREGARVVVCSRESDELDDVVEAIREDGGEAKGMRADVRDEFDVERLMETASRFGDRGIDLVVANAGVYHGAPGETPIDRESYASFDDHVRTNARGVFAAVSEALPHMDPDGRVLVTTGSIARDYAEGYGTYAVSKAAAEAVARAFAVDVDQTVGCVDPGRVDTAIAGSGHDPADVADQFVWAAECDPATLNGEVIDRKTWRSESR